MPAGQERLPAHKMLFSESNTRFIVEVPDEKKFSASMKGAPIWKLGHIRKDKSFKIFDSCGKLIVNTEIGKLKASWQSPFKDL
jgi:hypothetical protein